MLPGDVPRASCGDISRKRKLLEKQKEGKRRMKRGDASKSPRKHFLWPSSRSAATASS